MWIRPAVVAQQDMMPSTTSRRFIRLDSADRTATCQRVPDRALAGETALEHVPLEPTYLVGSSPAEHTAAPGAPSVAHTKMVLREESALAQTPALVLVRVRERAQERVREREMERGGGCSYPGAASDSAVSAMAWATISSSGHGVPSA